MTTNSQAGEAPEAPVKPPPPCFCDARHPRQAAIRCMLPKGHIGSHFCGGLSMGVEWED